ncbi:hypothetical protein LV457_11915 [Mycobacterium sp. MYCO198283]|uniref:hypothetical protein n=1 Tax=Mycobacterium sp. MYCO198283 TaxID=2883505 RepID=UPI001E401F56|nr:hypothetical protein [Mycobacterium sp. MYCO198283]MCG5432987.1 hypothetical protein [Mycobacterium sp. MYCO198283]
MARSPGRDNRLAYMDQASFFGVRATGQSQLGQVTWLYARQPDLYALQRCCDRLNAGGLLGRRIERSPLPFGRHRWVAGGGSPGLQLCGERRPRAELADWLDERSQLPLDPERGPSWHLGLLAMTDGTHAVTLVASHTVADGLGLVSAVAEAAAGRAADLGYPPPRSRTRRRAVAEDLAERRRSLREVARAARTGARLARTRRGATPPVERVRRPDVGNDAPLLVPAVTAHIAEADWDARVRLLGGTSNALAAAVAARLAQRTGRVVDGSATLSFPVSERTGDDARGNALSAVDVVVDPAGCRDDLRPIRAAIKAALVAHAATPNPFLPLLPLTPLVPRRAANALAGAAFAYDRLPVGCSNVGTLDPQLARIDGADADRVSVRLVEQGVRRAAMTRIGGQLFVAAGRALGSVFLTVVCHQAGVVESRQRLAELVVAALGDVDLAGTVE